LPLPERLVIASRQSRLALWQAEHVRARLGELYPGLRVEILGLTTRGGAEGVGAATTRTVVYSAALILVLDAYWAVTLLRTG